MGFALNEDRHSLQMLELEGRLRSFDKTRLESIDRSKGSLMQSYDGVFEESELDDLHDVLVPTESGVAGLFGHGRDDLDRFADLVPSAALGVGIGAPTARYLLVQGKDDGRAFAGSGGRRRRTLQRRFRHAPRTSVSAPAKPRTPNGLKKPPSGWASSSRQRKKKATTIRPTILRSCSTSFKLPPRWCAVRPTPRLTHLEKAVGARREARPAVRPCRPDQAVARALR